MASGDPITDPALLAELNGEPPPAPERQAPVAPPVVPPGGGGGGWGDDYQAPPTLLEDTGKGLVSGAATGLTNAGGIGGDVRQGMVGARGWLAKKLGQDPEAVDETAPVMERALKKLPILGGPTSKELQKAGTQATGLEFYEPKYRTGQYAKSVAESAANPLSYVGPGSAMMKGLQAVSAGMGSEWLGKMAEGSNAEPYARIVGGAAASLLPRAAMRAWSPLPTPPGRQAEVDILAQEGVTPTAGQQSGNRFLRYAEGELGDTIGAGGATTREMERIGREYTNAALARVGEHWAPNERITTVINRAHNRNGQAFDNLAATTQANYDPEFFNSLSRARNEYEHLFVNPLTAPMVEHYFEHAFNKATRGPIMDGAEYKSMRSRLERARRSTKDPELQQYLADMRQTYDDLVERHISPELSDAWRHTRNQYRNLLVLDRASTAAGEQAALGNISPAHLRSATQGAHGRRNYARGEGDFADLARAGESILSPLPQSGTTPRAMVHGAATGAGALLGAMHGDPTTALLAAAGMASVPPALGRSILSRPVQGYLRNQQMTGALRRGSGQRSAMARAVGTARRASDEEEEE